MTQKGTASNPGRFTQRQVWAAGTRDAAATAASSVTFGAVKMRDLRPSHLEAWVKAMNSATEKRDKPLEPSTIATRFNYVAMSLRAAVRDQVIARDPSANVKLPKRRRVAAAMEIPTVAEVGAAVSDPSNYFTAFMAVCAFAGLRLGEAAGLQVGDVNFLARTLQVRRQVQGENTKSTTVAPPKYGSERVVYIPEELTKLLARHIETFGTRPVTVDQVNPPKTGAEGLFWNPNSDHVDALWNRNSAGHAWRMARRAAGLDDRYTLHDLRHFYASGLIADGCDVVTVQRALGHSAASITLNVYSHLWPTAEDKTRKASADLMKAAMRAEGKRKQA